MNYVYDGDNVLEEVSNSGALVARYTMGLGVDEPLAMNRGGATYYYGQDGLGSVTALFSSSGALVKSIGYTSFGLPQMAPGGVENPYLFTGREWDPETGLYYYRARYYDPAVGRFLSEDSIGFAGGSNFYSYVGNNPTNFIDPQGLFPRSFHHDRTLELANAILGPQCRAVSESIASINRAQDDNHGPREWVQFLSGTGPGWARPGAHFPDAELLSSRRGLAFSSGSLNAFGAYLHSLQDSVAHGLIAPFDHFFRLDRPDVAAMRDHATQDLALRLTAAEIVAFRDQWLRQCECSGSR